MDNEKNKDNYHVKKSSIKILEEKDKSISISNPPNFYKLNICFEYSDKTGKLKPTKKLDSYHK